MEYSLIESFFGDFNRIYDALGNSRNDIVNSIPVLSFDEIKTVYAKYDERTGTLIRTGCSTLIMYDGWTFEESQIHTKEDFNFYTSGKTFRPEKKFIGYRLSAYGKLQLAKMSITEAFATIECLIQHGEYEKIKGLTERACCWDWYQTI